MPEQTLPAAQDMSATTLIGAGDSLEATAVGGTVDLSYEWPAGELVAGCREAPGAGVAATIVTKFAGAFKATGDEVDDDM